MKMNVKNWVMALLICLCMALLLLPGLSKDASAGTAVASVTIGDTTTEYDSLDAAVQAVANCTAEDKAVIKLLQSIDFGEYGGINIDAGVCTLDLNGRTLSHATVGVQNADVTIIDSHGGGAVIASEYWNAVSVSEQAVVTINGGTFTAYGNWCVEVHANGTGTGTALNIKAGTINCDNIGVYCAGGDLTISGGSINGENVGLYIYECDSIDIRGGIISGGTYSWRINAAWEPWRVYKVNIVQDYMGATFSGDIDGGDYTLESLLGEGAAYWLNGEKVTLKKNQTVLTGGDIVVMNADGHRHIAETYTDNGEDHSFTCVTCGKEITNPHSYDEITLQCPCGNEITEPHNYDENTLLCACGAISADAVVLVSKNGVPTSGYTTLHDAIQAVSTATADDNAVVKLLKDIKLGMGYLYTEAGVFTIDLNGKTLSSTGMNSALDVFYGDVTITDSGEGGMISAASYGISVYGNVTVESGTIHGDRAGIWVSGSLTVCGGTITGDDGIFVSEGQLMIYGGLIDGDGRGVCAEAAIVTISGGSIVGEDAISSWLTDVTITDGNIKGGFYGVA